MQDAIVAKQCLSSPEVFRATARTWAQTYADAPGDPNPHHQDSLARLTDMGVKR